MKIVLFRAKKVELVGLVVYVPTWAREILENSPTRADIAAIFANGNGEPSRDTDEFNEAWRHTLKAAKLRYRIPYVCRHTRAAEMLSMSVEPGKTAKQLGHTLEMFYRTFAEWIDEYGGKADFKKLEGVGEVDHRSETG